MLAPVVAESAIAQPTVVVELLTDGPARPGLAAARRRTWFSASSRSTQPESSRAGSCAAVAASICSKAWRRQAWAMAPEQTSITLDTAFGRHARCRYGCRACCRRHELPRAATTARFSALVCAGQGCRTCCRVRLAMRFPEHRCGSISAQIRRAATPVVGLPPASLKRLARAARPLELVIARIGRRGCCGDFAQAEVLNRRCTIAQAAALSSRCRRIPAASARRYSAAKAMRWVCPGSIASVSSQNGFQPSSSRSSSRK